MPKTLYYVGLKTRENGGETAFMPETQIRWFPGDSHAVADNVASRMLAHPDVFSDKSPEERAKLAEEARARALQEQAAARPAQAGGGTLEQLLAALPPGTTITLANGTKIEVPAGGLVQEQEDAAQFRPGATGLAGAHTSSVAQRLSAATGIDGALDGEVAMQLQETQTSPSTDASAISLAPGASVPAAAPAPAPAPAATPTVGEKPAAAAPKAKK